MKVIFKNPPRKFNVGLEEPIIISDMGEIAMGDDELVTFVRPDGKRYDITAKDWGFYATPSMNGRLKNEGFKTALIRNPRNNKHFMMIVDKEKVELFNQYMAQEKEEVVKWFDEVAMTA